MEYSFEFTKADLESVITIGVTTLSIVLYLAITSSSWLYRKINGHRQEATKEWVSFFRVLGFVLFGIVPMFLIFVLDLYSINDFGVILLPRQYAFLLIGLMLVAGTISFFVTNNKVNLSQYPQIRDEKWSIGTLVSSALSWMLYLLGYEFMFRGFLLFACVRAFGVWPAIVINIMVYSLSHIPKGMRETIGAIPFGLLVCILTLHCGCIWIAFGLHVVMALSNEWFSLYFHPKMNLVRRIY